MGPTNQDPQNRPQFSPEKNTGHISTDGDPDQMISDRHESSISSEPEEEIEVSAYLLIPQKISISSDYKKSTELPGRPTSLLASKGVSPMIWIDNPHGKIGFADSASCQVFNKSDVESFTIYNVLPAKGGGGAYLEVNLTKKGRSYTIFYGACHVFNAYRKKISALTGLEVNMAPESHDC